MFTIVLFLLVISILILVHEAGHLIAAKLTGVRAEEFSLGMGPIVAKVWHDGETQYNIRAFPIGGFVRLQGETEGAPLEYPIPEGEEERSFVNKSTAAKTFILTAGITMNYILGLLLIATVFFAIGQPIAESTLVLTEIAEDSPAAEAALQPDDVITGFRVPSEESFVDPENSQAFSDFIVAQKGSEIILQIQRGDETITTSLTPRVDPPEGQGSIGITYSELTDVSYTPVPWWQVPGKSLQTSVELVGMMFVGITRMVGDLVSQGVVPNDVAGPIGIAKLTGEVANQGFYQLLQFMALISINLAVVNILPFPALDGGRLVFVLIEGLTGKKPAPKYEGWIHAAGLLLLLALMVVITYFDIQRFL